MRKLVFAAVLLLALSARADNYVLVLLDDWGYDKFSAAKTPNLWTFASNGIYFSRFASEPNCSPSRASLLTGRHPFRHGVGTVVSLPNPLTNQGLDASERNLAHALNGAGFRTSAVGKWHVCGGGNDALCATHPNRAGFQSFRGNYGNLDQKINGLPATGTYLNYEWIENGTITVINDAADGTPNDEYLTTYQVNAAIEEIGGTEPFFLWLALTAPHSPYHCPPNLLTPTYDAVCTPIGGETQNAAYYHAALEAADTELQRFFNAVDFNDTTVFVVGDNGTDPTAVQAPYDATHAKGTVYRQGSNVPLFVRGKAVAVSERGTTGTQSIHITDLAATLLDLAGLGADLSSGRAGVVDGIPITSYLAESSTASIRQTSFTQLFSPNGLPYAPSATHRVGVAWPYRRLMFAPGSEFFYNAITDEHETTALDPMSLTPTEQTAYDLLDDIVHLPDDGPTAIPSGRYVP